MKGGCYNIISYCSFRGQTGSYETSKDAAPGPNLHKLAYSKCKVPKSVSLGCDAGLPW